MKLEAMHHITMITGDARKNVDFYADLLGLRMVKKTVNFDSPSAYHLYFGDEAGTPGTILTWFEFPGARPGNAGRGDIHTIELGVASPDALDFWAKRLADKGHGSERLEHSLAFSDYDGLRYELVVAEEGNAPLRARHPEVPEEHAIVGVEGARAYARREPAYDRDLLTTTLGFTEVSEGEYRVEGNERSFRWGYDRTDQHSVQGAGSVHHIAWHSLDDDHTAWQARAQEAGMHVTPVIDRDYFKSIYFRQPQGVLFEVATSSPGFAVDEDPQHLGEELRLPQQHEHLRSDLERLLTPLTNPRTVAAAP